MKSIFKSLTAQGGIVTVLPTVLPILFGFFGIEITGSEVGMLSTKTAAVISGITELVGLSMVFYGRFRAGGVSMMGK